MLALLIAHLWNWGQTEDGEFRLFPRELIQQLY
jgi:hypothetical protein